MKREIKNSKFERVILIINLTYNYLCISLTNQNSVIHSGITDSSQLKGQKDQLPSL